MLEFLTLTMLPIVTAYEQELNRKLLTAAQRKSGLHFKFDMDALLRADAATMAEVNYKAVRSGWMTPDEIRFTKNLPKLPNGIGSYPLVSQDLATLEYTVKDKPKVLMRGVNEGGGQSQSQDQTQHDQGKDSVHIIDQQQLETFIAIIGGAAQKIASMNTGNTSTPEDE